MKNGAKTNALLNYDGSNRKMKFKQQDEIMILTNTQAIDTVFIASHKFIPYSRNFLEVVEMPNGNLYINGLTGGITTTPTEKSKPVKEHTFFGK